MSYILNQIKEIAWAIGVQYFYDPKVCLFFYPIAMLETPIDFLFDFKFYWSNLIWLKIWFSICFKVLVFQNYKIKKIWTNGLQNFPSLELPYWNYKQKSYSQIDAAFVIDKLINPIDYQPPKYQTTWKQKHLVI